MKPKHLLSIWMILVAASALLLGACAPAAPATPAAAATPVAQPTVVAADPITIVQSYYDALNGGEFDRMATLMAEDMVATYPGGKYSGKQEVIAANQDAIGSGLSFELSDLKDTDGRVTSCFKVLQKDALIDQGCTGVTIVRRGQIIFDGLAPDEPEYVVQRYYQALDAKDVDLAMSFVASDAVFINPTGTYEGASAIRKSLEGINTDGITFDLDNFQNTDGRVVYDYKVKQGTNLLDQGTDGLTIVKDGKIVFDGTEKTEKASDPASIAQNFYRAINDGDIEAAMSLVAENVTCRGQCYFTGKELFRAFMMSSINGGFRIDMSDLTVDGDKVSYIVKVYSKAGFFQGAGKETLQIKDGMIVLMEGVAQ